MTAEIAIFNRGAVVLAADSAVTVSSPGGGRQKVYRSVTKLFALSAHRPVAIMVHGAASIMGIPWETIIKGYRDQLGERRFDTLEAYAEDFFSHAGGYLAHLEEDAIEEQVYRQVGALFAVLEGVSEAMVGQWSEDEDEKKRPMEELLERALRETVRVTEGHLSHSDPYVPLHDELVEQITKIRRRVVREALDESGLGELCDPAMRRRIHRIAQQALTRHNDWLTAHTASGLVIAGFGEREIFPVLRAWDLSGLLTPQGPMRVLTGANDLDLDTGEPERQSAGIHTFAQDDMMQSFMEGMEPMLRQHVLGLARRALGGLADIAQEMLAELAEDDELYEAMDEVFEAQVPRLYDRFEQELREIQYKEQTSPVLDMLDMLPREELAVAAEALVNLQSLKQRMTMKTESVSGPIDVVMISKGDGLVWVKRK
jgi:hypothetical protein